MFSCINSYRLVQEKLMKAQFNMAAAVALVTLAVIGYAPAASAQTLQTEGFLQACNSNEDFLANLSDAQEGAEQALSGLCGCLVTELGDVSQSDLDILAQDLAGTATDETRQAYTTYPDLSQRAGEALNACLVNEGIVDDPDGEAAPDAGADAVVPDDATAPPADAPAPAAQ